jgi:hypothetical protein
VAIADDFTVDLVDKKILTTQTAVNGIFPNIYSMNELYVFLQDFFDEPDRMDDDIPLSAQTPTEYTMLNTWFIDDDTIKSLFGGSLITTGWTYAASAGITALRWTTGSSDAPIAGDIGVTLTGGTSTATGVLLAVDTVRRIAWVRNDSANQFDDNENVTGTGVDLQTETTDGFATGDSGWANLFSLGTIPAESELYVVQENNFFYVPSATAVPTTLTSWWDTDVVFTDPRGFGGAGSGQIDLMVKVRETSALIDSGKLSVYARQYSKTFDFFSITSSSTGAGRNPIPLSAGDDLNNITEYDRINYVSFTGNDLELGDVILLNATSKNTAVLLDVPPSVTPAADTIGYYLIGKDLTDFVDATVYDVKGDTGTFTIERDAGEDVAGAATETTGTKTDDTTNAVSAGASDMALVPAATNTSGYYFGYATKFDQVILTLGTSGTGTYTLTWEYSTGADGWSALTVTDNTGDYKNAPAVYTIDIAETDIPADWATDTIDSVGPIYWIRARSDAGTVTINPLGTQAWIAGANGPKVLTDVTSTFGQALRDIDNDGNNEEYSCVIDCNLQLLAAVYERLKYITRRGATQELDDGATITDVQGEHYVSIGDILVNYDLEGGAALVEGELVEVEGAATNNAILTSLHDQGTTGFLILRKVKGTFANDDIIQSNASPANEVTQLNASETIVPVKASPLATFAGGTMFTARGVVLDNVNNAEANNYQVVTSDGLTVNPPQTVTVLVQNLLAQDRVAVFRLTGAGLIIDKTEYSSAATGNAQDNEAFIVSTTISTEAPTGGATDLAGVFRVVDNLDSEEQRYRYASYTAATFTLVGASNNAGSVTTTDATGVTLNDSAGSFQAGPDDIQIGDQLRNTSTGDVSIVDSIASDIQLTVDPPVTNGFTNADNYVINKLVRAYATGDTAYVSFVDKVIPAGDDEASSLIEYSIDIPVIVRVRRSIATKILPFSQESTIQSSGMSVSAIRAPDTIAS